MACFYKSTLPKSRIIHLTKLLFSFFDPPQKKIQNIYYTINSTVISLLLTLAKVLQITPYQHHGYIPRPY